MKPIIRIIACLLVAALLFGGTAFADHAPNEITVGTLTSLDGHLYGNLLGNNTTDIDLRLLLHDYSTVALTADHLYDVNMTAIKAYDSFYTGINKTYVFTLQDDLYYNDGSRITAKDYVFTVLLQSSPFVANLGGSVTNYMQLIGWDEYSSGENAVFKGVQLIDDSTFSLMIANGALDYYYELLYATVYPTPVSVLAPGCEVKDDGSGAYIEGEFTEELLAKTLFDEETGYMYFPQVTSGAYQLESIDREKFTASFTLNPYYKGNYEGIIPTVERINVIHVTNDNMFEVYASGEADVIHKIMKKENVDAALRRTDAKTISFLRSGYGFLSFACEDEAVSSADVRRAIAYCLDKDKLTEDFTGDYGYRVYSCYGAGQWMSLFNEGESVDKIEENAPKYKYDLGAALTLVQSDGWTLNSKGRAYSTGDGVRYRRSGDELIPLEIRMCWGDDSFVGPEAAAMLEAASAQIGFRLIAEEIPFDKLLRQYYREEEREYNLFVLATDFDYVFNPYPMVSDEEEFQNHWNTTAIREGQLIRDAKELNNTKNGEIGEYLSEWINFQLHWASILPTIPLYTNIYYDLLRPEIEGYYADSFTSWALSIPYVKIS